MCVCGGSELTSPIPRTAATLRVQAVVSRECRLGFARASFFSKRSWKSVFIQNCAILKYPFKFFKRAMRPNKT